MTYDDILKSLGGFGKYQFKVYFLLCLPAIICAFHKLVGVFLQITPAFRCRLENELANSSYWLPEDVWNANYPWDKKTQNYSTCTFYSKNQTIDYCNSYIYDDRNFKNTVVTDWNLVCDRAYYVDAANSVFMSGVMIGSIIFGHLSDQYGRKITFFISLVIEVVFGILTALSPNIIIYNITRFVVGATTSGVFLVAYVIALEMVGPEKRLVAGVVIQMFFSFGYVMLVPFAYFINEWRQLQLTLTLIGVLFFPYWWQIPESVRWLLTKQKIDEAKIIVSNIAKTNNVHFNTDTMDSFIVKNNEVKGDDKVVRESTLMDIFKTPNLRKKAIIIFFNWFVNSGTYYGLAYNTSIIQQNVFTNFFLAGFVEFPAYTLLLFLLNRWGRRKTLSMFMVIAGFSLISIIFVPSENKLLVTILVMTGKLAITSSYGTIYIFTVEQFPTVIRNVALGAASTFAKAGSIVAPLVNILGQIWIPLPMTVFGVVALIGGLFSLILPETLNRELPETIEDAESFGRKRKMGK